jgi:Protein of unknown function (DUF2167)
MKILMILGLILFVLHVIMAIKVGRDSALFGILTFLLPPIGVARNWGTDNDVRILGLAWLVLSGWYWYEGSKVQKQMLSQLGPELQAKLERGEELTEEEAVRVFEVMGGGGITGNAAETIREMGTDSGRDIEAKFRSGKHKVALIDRQRGLAALPEAKARLEIPDHFRFLEGAAVREAVSADGRKMKPSFVGWVLHETTDMSDDLDWNWAIEVHAFANGHVAGMDFTPELVAQIEERARAAATKIADLDGENEYHSEFAGFRVRPGFDAQRKVVTWVSELKYPSGDSARYCEALRLGRTQQVSYRLPFIAENAEELCLRKVRLMAANTRFELEQDYEFKGMLDGAAEIDLAGVIADEEVLAALEAQAKAGE